MTHTVAGVAALAPLGSLVGCGDDGDASTSAGEGGSTTACCDDTTGTSTTTATTATTDTTGMSTTGSTGPTPECLETVDDVLGPFYRADAPFRSDLAEPDTPGVRITVTGRVLDLDCEPIAEAMLDLWQANDDGQYDNDGSMPELPPDVYILRGRVQTDAEGRFEFSTVVPGHYLNGNQYRPSHIHVIASAAGKRELTTQLYFPDDPFNADDPFLDPSLIMDVEDQGEQLAGQFDFVLADA